MGQEILYCYKCQRRIVGAEFSKGQAFQVGDQVSCSSCAADLLQSLDAKQREQLLAKMFQATQERQKHSSGALPALDTTPAPPKGLKKSTVRLPAVETPAPPRAGRPAPALAIGAGVVVVAVVVLAVALGGSSKPAAVPQRPTEPAPVQRAAAPPPAETEAHAAARLAVTKARDFATRNPKDLEGQINFWRESHDAAAGTPYVAEARRELDAVLARRKDAVPKELAELEKQAQSYVDAQQIQIAIDLLQGARPRYTVAEWTQPLDRRLGELHRGLAPPPPPQPAAAPQANVAPAPAPPRPALPPAEAAAFARASARDYAAALEQLKGTPDADAVRAAAAVPQEAQDLLSKWPRGQSLSVELRDAGKVEGTVVRTEPGRVALKQASGGVWIDTGEITPGSLAAIYRTRPTKNDRAAALFCVLEGDVDAARRILGDKQTEIPEKFWRYGSTFAAQPLPAKESEARDLWRSSEEGVLDFTKTAPSVEICKMLLRDYAATAFVARNRAAIAARAAGGNEYLFCTDILKPVGTWKPSKPAKLEAAWTCEKDGAGNYVDLAFTALANTEYRCWVYAGACCQETFTFSAQGTEMKAEPGTPATVPVKLSLVGLKKTHAMHTGPKTPSTWAWIPVPLPKYAGMGVKTVRLITDQQGFSIAFAAVTSQKEQPRDSELKEFERTIREIGVARKPLAPAAPTRAGKIIFAHDFAKGAGTFKPPSGAAELVDVEPNGAKAIAISPNGVGVKGFQVVTKPSTILRFRVKATVDLDFFEVMSWIQARGANAWFHITNLKKDEWRTVEIKVGELRFNWNGDPIMGETVDALYFYYVKRPDDTRVLLTDFELRD